MNAEYLAIVKMFLPEIVLTIGALLVLAIDLCLGKANTRRGLVVLAVVVALVAAGSAWNQRRTGEEPLPFYVQATEKAVAEAPGMQSDVKSTIASDMLARAVVADYKALRHTTLQQAAGERTPTDANLASPAFNAWWLFRVDDFALIFKIIFALALALVLLLSTRFPTERYRAEFAALLMFATVGLMIMVASLDLVCIFLGLELASLCFYALAAWHKGDARSAEAGTKYLLLGSLASAIFIYGVSLFFVQFGSTHLSVINNTLQYQATITGNTALTPLTIVALFLVVVSFLFKVAGAPFHLWAPDVYQGAPTAMVAFLSTASKAAGFAVLVRVLYSTFIGFDHVTAWGTLIGVVAALSILVGNLVAIHQNNIKRMLAYSGIAQAGYILVGLTAMRGFGDTGFPGGYGDQFLPVTAIIFYLFLYMVANIGAFAIVGIVARESGSEDMKAFAGLRERNPILAFAMTLLMLSLGGIPLLSGFVGKWYLFMAGVYEDQYILVLIGTTMSVVSMYYYLLVVKQMYIIPAADGAKPIRVGFLAAIGLTLIVAVTMAIGMYWQPFFDIAQAAAKSLIR